MIEVHTKENGNVVFSRYDEIVEISSDNDGAASVVSFNIKEIDEHGQGNVQQCH